MHSNFQMSSKQFQNVYPTGIVDEFKLPANKSEVFSNMFYG